MRCHFPTAEEILCAPGQLHEVETRLVDGRLQRVYKHLPPTLRDFWMRAVEQFGNQTYIVFGDERLTYKEVHEKALHAAGVFYAVYGVRKGRFSSLPVWSTADPLSARRPRSHRLAKLLRIPDDILGVPYDSFFLNCRLSH